VKNVKANGELKTLKEARGKSRQKKGRQLPFGKKRDDAKILGLSKKKSRTVTHVTHRPWRHKKTAHEKKKKEG